MVCILFHLTSTTAENCMKVTTAMMHKSFMISFFSSSSLLYFPLPGGTKFPEAERKNNSEINTHSSACNVLINIEYYRCVFKEKQTIHEGCECRKNG